MIEENFRSCTHYLSMKSDEKLTWCNKMVKAFQYDNEKLRNTFIISKEKLQKFPHFRSVKNSCR